MVPRSLLALLAVLLIGSILLAGCGQKAVRQGETPAETPAVTPRAYMGTLETTPAPATPVPTAPVPAQTPESFPYALAVGTLYTYGRPDISTEVTVYMVRTLPEYEFWSWQWGQYGNTTAKEGHHFLFAFVRLIDRGTARARLPAPQLFVLHSDGRTYRETTDRDNSIPIRGLHVKQYEYYYEDRAGWIDPGESNKIEGFILYEVPLSVTKANSYLDVIFSSKANATWKLG